MSKKKGKKKDRPGVVGLKKKDRLGLADLKRKKRSYTGLIIGFLIGLLVVYGGYVLFGGGGGGSYDQSEIDSFAKCLTDSGTVMYGTFWCPHCAKTKAMFGSSFQYVNYVECDPRGDDEQSFLCIEKEIEAYDTWEFASGDRVIGEPSFEQLAAGSGCVAPVEIESG